MTKQELQWEIREAGHVLRRYWPVFAYFAACGVLGLLHGMGVI